MRKILALLLGLLFVQAGMTQEIKINSVFFDSSDVSALDNPIYDLNDDICALVILNAQGINEFDVKGSIVKKTSLQNIHYIYLPNKTKRISIYHQNCIPLTFNFNELFNISSGLKGGKTYYITIEAPHTDNPELKQPQYTNGSNYLIFESTIPITRLVVNGQEWQLQNGKAIKKMVRCGEYTYSASADGYKDVNGTITVTKSIDPVVVSVQFKK